MFGEKKMRSSEDMTKLIMDVVINDERIRAVTMEGSRVSKNATHDQYCDFDISYGLVFEPV